MNKIFMYIILGMIIGAALGYCGSGGINKIKEAKKRQQLEQTQELKVKQATKDMIKKHNAITNFESNLVFTSQLQETILGANEEPVYFKGTISDIQKKDNKYILYLDDYYLDSDVIYEITITPEQYKNILLLQRLPTIEISSLVLLPSLQKSVSQLFPSTLNLKQRMKQGSQSIQQLY